MAWNNHWYLRLRGNAYFYNLFFEGQDMRKLLLKLFRKVEHPRDVHARLYGVIVDIDKVWEDRNDLHDAGDTRLQAAIDQMNFEERRNAEARVKFDLEAV
jgi:hypothetical protein